jgi:sialate O-acetylesterase
MIAPLTPYAIKGVLWYQGEANAGRGAEYSKLFPAMITDWRSKWNEPELPFLFVQLANFGPLKDQPAESYWAELREAQTMTLTLPKTGMAVTHDIGEFKNIHPLNKGDVGKRLALAAEKVIYNENIVYSGPIYKDMRVDGNRIIINFTNLGSGLVVKNGDMVKYIAIAGADKKFVWASAKVEGDHLVVWNDTVTAPVAVRYAWAESPDGSNLYNKEGLPASSFRTDH